MRNFKLTLEQYAAKCEAARMRVSNSKSKTIVLSRQRVECRFQDTDELLPQVEEFKYLLFTSERTGECETDRLIGEVSAVIRMLYQSVVDKRDLSIKQKWSIYQSTYVPTLLSQALGSDQKNEVSDTSSRNEFTAKRSGALPWR